MMQFLFWERNLSLNLLDLNCLNGQIWKRETFHCQNLLVSIYTKYANWKQACNTNISTCQNILPCCYFSTSPYPARVDHASTLAGCLTKLKRCHFHNYSFPWQPFFDDDNFRNGYWEIRQGVNYWSITELPHFYLYSFHHVIPLQFHQHLNNFAFSKSMLFSGC